MSWSKSAPTLPAGVSWSGYKTGNRDNDHSNPNYDFRVKARIARGPGSTLYVHVQLQGILRVYGAVATLGQLYGQVKTGDGDYSTSSAYSGNSQNYEDWFTVKNIYWTGTAGEGETVTVRARQGNSNGSPAVTFSAPALLAIPAWFNDGEAVRQITNAYANVGGVIKACEVWANVGGMIKKIG